MSDLQSFKNVDLYSCVESTEYSWKITCEREAFPDISSVPIYFILDSANQGAFSHWVYENSTWLPRYLKVREEFPSCKLVLEEWKDFKKLYLNFYGISLSDVCLHSEICSPNYCIFHTYTSLNDEKIPDIYYRNLESYKEKLDFYVVQKDISILYLPRGRKENLQGPNNRQYNIQDDLKQYVSELGGLVYETDTTTSLETQILLVKRAHLVILDYGSNLWVNGLFAKNSHIVCLNIGWNQHPQFPSLGVLWNKISNVNSIHQIFAHNSSSQGENDVPTINFYMPEILHTIQGVLMRI